MMALREDDLDWFKTTLIENSHKLHLFTDSFGKNIFHEIASSILLENRLSLYVAETLNILRSTENIDMQEYLNSYAIIDEDEYTPIHIAIMKHKKV